MHTAFCIDQRAEFLLPRIGIYPTSGWQTDGKPCSSNLWPWPAGPSAMKTPSLTSQACLVNKGGGELRSKLTSARFQKEQHLLKIRVTQLQFTTLEFQLTLQDQKPSTPEIKRQPETTLEWSWSMGSSSHQSGLCSECIYSLPFSWDSKQITKLENQRNTTLLPASWSLKHLAHSWPGVILFNPNAPGHCSSLTVALV